MDIEGCVRPATLPTTARQSVRTIPWRWVQERRHLTVWRAVAAKGQLRRPQRAGLFGSPGERPGRPAILRTPRPQQLIDNKLLVKHSGLVGEEAATEHPATAAQLAARRHLMAIGAGDLPRLPWMVGNEPHDDATLIRYALWRANSGVGLNVPEDLYAALRLLESARAEMDGLEAGLLFVARAEGLTWPQIAEHLGVRSPQAAQQRFGRVTSRAEPSDGPE